MKKIMIALLTVVMLFTMVGCGTTATLKDGNNSGFTDSYWVYIDEETGVNYIVFSAYYKGGICPRYNTDGSLYVTDVTEED